MTPIHAQWKYAYARQRVYAKHGCYYVAGDIRITEALRKIFVKTEIRHSRMNGGKPASFVVSALHRPMTGERLSHWKM